VRRGSLFTDMGLFLLVNIGLGEYDDTGEENIR